MNKSLLKSTLAAAALLTGMSLHAVEWVDWDRIQHWAGDPDGENRCALVIDFQDGKNDARSLVWGFRWNGTATGEDLVRAVAGQSRILTATIQYTGTMGSTLNSLGLSDGREHLDHISYDFDRAALAGEVSFGYFEPNASMGQDTAPGYETIDMVQAAIDRARTTGIIEHPLNAFVYGYPAYDYDYWQLDPDLAEDEFYRWQSGWYDGYWSYWHGKNDYDYMGYSGLGMSSTVLTNECVQAWKYIVFNGDGIGYYGGDLAEELDYDLSNYMEEMHEPEPVVQPVDQSKVGFWVGTGEKAATVVFRFNDGHGPENLVYGYRWSGGWDDALSTVIGNIVAADARMQAVNDGSGTKIIYDSDHNGTIEGAYDHTDLSGEWDCYVKRTIDEGFSKVNAGRWLNPNAVLVFSHRQSGDVAGVSLPYLLYRPALDSENIITIPESVDYAIADKAAEIPLFIQVPEGAKMSANAYSWTRDAAITAVTTTMKVQNLMGTITDYKDFRETTGTVKVRGSYTPAGETKAVQVYSNEMTLTLRMPERPVTAMHYASDELTWPLNRAIDNELVFEPADATYTKVKFTTGNRAVATVNATTGVASTTKTAGTSVISAAYVLDADITASFTVNAELLKPVEDITFDCVNEDGEIVLTPKEMFGLIPVVTPADADIPDATIKISGNGTGKDDYIATMYTVNIWPDGKTMKRFNELSGHREGECLLHVESADGSGFSRDFTVRVADREREPAIDYTEGTIMLNEEWYGHTNGGLNWYSPDYEITYQAYERENPGMSFGCTSQYGLIYDGKLIVTSKQAVDAGDPLPGGGRLVVADAATLKRLGSIDDLMVEGETRSGDGRGACGAGPGRVYVGTHSGIYIVDINDVKVIGKIAGSSDGDDDGKPNTDPSGSLYNGQIGDMLLAGRYAYATCQSKGLYIIDTTTDEIFRFIEDTGVQTVSQSADGTVWYVTNIDKQSHFVPVDPVTLEEGEHVVVPAEIGTVSCGWGAWRTVQFTGAHSVNSLFFAPGSGVSNGGSGVYWRYDIESQKFTKIFDIAGLEAHTPNVPQGAYGTIRYDDRTGELIIGTTEFKASGHYRYNWTHFVNAETGELNRTLELRPYYWFQSMPIFPDKYDAEISLETIDTSVEGDVAEHNLLDYVTDPDNIDANINFALAPMAANDTADEDEPVAPAAEVSLEGHTLTVKPLHEGKEVFTLMAESNGRTVSRTFSVNVAGTPAGVSAPDAGAWISCDGRRVVFCGFAGNKFSLYDMSGRGIVAFDVDSDRYTAQFDVPSGVYVVRNADGYASKIVLR